MTTIALEIPVDLLDPTRFWSKVDTSGECWQWLASCDRMCYGQFRIGATMRRAHRVAYVLLVGPIPDGLTLDHLCGNRTCVNPAHLEPVTGAENARRGESINRKKTHCHKGHPYDAENTAFDSNGWRACVTCRRANEALRYAQAKSAVARASASADGAGVTGEAAA